jgi:hypothetical protein
MLTQLENLAWADDMFGVDSDISLMFFFICEDMDNDVL